MLHTEKETMERLMKERKKRWIEERGKRQRIKHIEAKGGMWDERNGETEWK
jgi:hypothetical protein